MIIRGRLSEDPIVLLKISTNEMIRATIADKKVLSRVLLLLPFSSSKKPDLLFVILFIIVGLKKKPPQIRGLKKKGATVIGLHLKHQHQL